MNTTNKTWSLMALYFAISSSVGAQQQGPPATKPPNQTAQSEAGDPRADTSNPAMAAPAAPAAPASPGAPITASPTTRRVPSAHGAPEPNSGAKSIPKTDRLDLDTATVTGDREQPKVMYIVPWKRSDIGDLAGKPMNSLVDEILAPVDRDVFKREVVYYHAVQADASQNGASAKPSQQGEK